MKRDARLLLVLTFLFAASTAAGQPPPSPASPPSGGAAAPAPAAAAPHGAPAPGGPGAAPDGAPAAPGKTAPRRADDPFDAYRDGLYDQALQKFVDVQVERPDDPKVTMNIGASHYQMRNYEEAEKAFSQVALSPDAALRERALYNLGNVAYRQGKLQDAIARYQAALELDPNDADAKFNLEFVRDEIRRRQQEAQKRQEQQQQQQGGEQQEGDQGEKGEKGEQGEQQQGEQGEQQQPGTDGPDADQDGLSDAGEKSAQNPTDPKNPDTDRDGLADGQEDQNRNGKVDAGETNPNDPDSDDDGQSDAAEAAAAQGAEAQPPGPDDGKMSREQGGRLLDSLQESRPPAKPKRGGGSRRPAKDW